MTADFQSLTTPRAAGPRRFEANIPDTWQQGRGAFGGLVIANLVRALEASEPEPDRALRSLTAELCGPALPGPATITVEALRRGSGVSTLAVRLEQGGEIVAHAVGVLGRARADRPRRTLLAPPALRPWHEVDPLAEQMRAPGISIAQFASHFEFRLTGPRPFSGGTEPVVSGWIRPREPGPARDAAYVAACADAWWPAIFSVESTPRPVATIAYTLELVDTCAGLDPEAPFFHRASIAAEHEGHIVEFRELWGEDGRLIALNQQTLVIIR